MEWEAVYQIDYLTEEIKKRIYEDPGIFRFKMLPLISVRTNHPWIKNPPNCLRKIDFTKTSYALTWSINRALLEASHLARTWAPNGNRWVLGSKFIPSYVVAVKDGNNYVLIPEIRMVEMRIAHPAVISLSLQLRQGTKMTDDHILSITTRFAAKYLPVVVAAGNWGSFGEDTLSPLARLPWTIAVGATFDREGTILHPDSSTGKINSNQGEGVTVVAYGRNDFVPDEYGTSFAAPRVAKYILLLTSFILQLRNAMENNRMGKPGGTPLLQYILVDKGFNNFNPRPEMPLSMIPGIGINVEAVNFTLDMLHEAGLKINLEPTPAVVRQMLTESAQPMNTYQPHQVGYGFVSEDSIIRYLSKFTGAKLMELFLKGTALSDSINNKLSDTYLANNDELEMLCEISVKSALKYSIDFSTGEIHASMRDPGMYEKETGFHKIRSNHIWPPVLNEFD